MVGDGGGVCVEILMASLPQICHVSCKLMMIAILMNECSIIIIKYFLVANLIK